MGGAVIDRIKRPRWFVRVVRFFGRRGLILGLCGTAWMAIGYIFATDDVERFSRPGPGGPLQFLDENPWPGIVWMVAGAIAFTVGHVRRMFDGEDALGFTALVVPVLLWALAYAWSGGLYIYTEYIDHIPDRTRGRGSAAGGFIIYIMITGFLFIVARWPDPIDAEENVRRSERKSRRDAQRFETGRVPGPPWASHDPYDPSGP